MSYQTLACVIFMFTYTSIALGGGATASRRSQTALLPKKRMSANYGNR